MTEHNRSCMDCVYARPYVDLVKEKKILCAKDNVVYYYSAASVCAKFRKIKAHDKHYAKMPLKNVKAKPYSQGS